MITHHRFLIRTFSLCGFLVQLSCLAAWGQTYSTYTDISGFYDYQTNYRAPQYVRACPGTPYLHAIMMVSDDSLNPSPSRRTAYAFSSDNGTSWTTFNQIRVPPRRSGFPSLDILQGVFANAAAISNHSVIGSALQSTVFIDHPVGTGAFSELSPPIPFGADDPIFAEAGCASDGSVLLLGSRPAGITTHRARTSDYASWTPWAPVTQEFVSDGYVAEGNLSGRIGIAIAAPSSPLWWLESTDNGATWPPVPTQLLPELIPAGPDTFVITPGLDLVYLSSDTLITFGVTRPINGNPTHRFSGIGFYSRRTGFVHAVPHHLVNGAIDTLVKRQVNMFPVGYPAIGISGSTIAIAFQAFMADTSPSGFNYADVFLTQSTDRGSSWSAPVNLTLTNNLDERYVSVSKWNPSGVVHAVFPEDPQPGSAVFGGDGSPLARSRQRYLRLGTPLPVDETGSVPGEFALYQNYPNPFNPSTTIPFDLPASGYTSLKVYDLLGREVAALVNETLTAGRHTKLWNAGDVSTGIYFYRLVSNGLASTRKLVLVR